MSRTQIDVDLSIVEIFRDKRMTDVEAVAFIAGNVSLEDRWSLCEALEKWEADRNLIEQDPVLDRERRDRDFDTHYSGGDRQFGDVA